MKRAIILIFTGILLFQGMAYAQQRDPLVMRVELEWTVIGAVGGAVVGIMLWLTDPANPSTSFSESAVGGAGWGAVAGAGFGAYMLKRNVQFPATVQADPVATPRISSDPVAVEMKKQNMLLAFGQNQVRSPRISLSLMKFRF